MMTKHPHAVQKETEVLDSVSYENGGSTYTDMGRWRLSGGLPIEIHGLHFLYRHLQTHISNFTHHACHRDFGPGRCVPHSHHERIVCIADRMAAAGERQVEHPVIGEVPE